MKEERDIRSLLISFAAGGLVGAGIALLLAPKSGRELRKDITDLAEETRGKVTAAVEKGREMYAEGTAAVKHAVESGKTGYNAGMDAFRKAA